MEFDKDKFKRDLQRKIYSYGSIVKAAKESGIDLGVFYRIKTMKMPTIPILCKVCEWLDEHPSKYFKIGK